MTPTKIWVDTDLSVGMKRHAREGYCDVDDGFAIWQLMNSDKVEIMGISAVFGNTLIERAYPLCLQMSEEFGMGAIPVYQGAGAALDLRNPEQNEAVDALAAALKEQPLTIMAIRPATNVGLLLLHYPELASRINEVVLVAGRRKPTDYFAIGNKGNHARDLNFDLDNDAFRLMFERGLAVTLCPFEISNKVWLKAADLDRLAAGAPAAQWLAHHSRPWLQQWVDQGAEGFNPFDVLASHYLLAPQDIISEKIFARLEIHPDDTLPGQKAFKQYLICDEQTKGFPVTYCYDVVSDYHEKLMRSLLPD